MVKSGRPGVRAARGVAVVMGYQVRLLEFSVEQNGFSAADSFSLTLPFFVKDEKGDKILANGPDVASALVTSSSIPVQLRVGFGSVDSGLVQVMDGEMDTIAWGFSVQGETVTLHGRSKAGSMIDTKIVEKYPNLTASAIAQKFAGEHGLTPVITPTAALAGTYYNQQTAAIGRETSQWDLLLYLAKRENFIARARRGKLYFGPYDAVVGASSTPIPYTWGHDIDALNIERSPHASRNITITVLTYDRGKKKQIKETASSTTQGAKSIAGQVDRRSRYNLTYNIPGLTRQQAQNRAREILAQLSRSQIIGQLQAAGNTDLEIDRQIRLYGVGPGLEQAYFLNRVTHKFSLTNGYTIDAGFSTQTDYTQSQMNDLSAGGGLAGSASGVALVSAAASQNGRQYWSNACAHAVNDVLKSTGIDVSGATGNPNWVPNYVNVGTKVSRISDMVPGDIVLGTNYGHIGIYAGNGEMWHVSSAAGHKWIKAPIGSNFQEGRRINE